MWESLEKDTKGNKKNNSAGLFSSAVAKLISHAVLYPVCYSRFLRSGLGTNESNLIS